MGRYRFVAEARGVRVEHPGRSAVAVQVEGWAFVVTRAPHPPLRFPLSDVLGAAQHVHWLARSRRRPVRAVLPEPPDEPPHPWVVAGHLLRLRERVLVDVDPRVARVYEAAVAEGGVAPAIVFGTRFYAEPYLAADVVRHRAAAIAVAYLETDLLPAGRTAPLADEAAVALLREWRGLFSPTGRSHRSLDRTLMRLPAGLPAEVVCGLRHVPLARPLTTPLELAWTCTAALAYAARARHARFASHGRVIQHARSDEIHGVLHRIGEATGRTLSSRRPDDLREAALFLADYPDPYDGSLAGLAARAIAWHEAERRPPRAPGPDRAHASGRTALPPIPLPTAAGLTFLDTVAAVEAEGRRMRHCIRTYARDAQRGRCYLFHVEFAGEHASVEVAPHGRVVQAKGPENAPNAACAYGRRALAAWGRGLSPDAARRRDDEQRLRRSVARHLALFPEPPAA